MTNNLMDSIGFSNTAWSALEVMLAVGVAGLVIFFLTRNDNDDRM